MNSSGTDTDTAVRPRRMSTATGPAALIQAVRARQWHKNALVLAPLLPAGDSLRDADLRGVALAFVAFCLISSSIYLINDAKDVEADRAHPVKRFRPIASGRLSVRTAVVTAVLAAVGGFALGAVDGLPLTTTLAVYYAIQLAYCFGMKHEPVLEMISVASGFLLRAIAGGVAADLALSQWFLLTTAFGSLYMAAGKRYGEARMGERTGAGVRRVLDRYTTTYLRFVWTLSATVVVLTYALWAFEVGEQTGSVWPQASLVPFTMAILRFAIDIDAGTAEEPEVIVLHDRVLLALGIAWAISLGLAVYL
jgi:decaprenyl-phosphate phosphoribosyltransferase